MKNKGSGTFLELLAPAGSFEGMKAVISAGADAVYMGGTKFGARAYADNPDDDALTEAIDYAHLRGRRVYLTVNTLLKDREMSSLYDFLKGPYEHGVDAVLVQDFGVLSFIAKNFPDLPIHASTQMTVTGGYGASFLREHNVTRIVPARELSLPELTQMARKSSLEIEVFIHGALCVCYSGQCLYSSMLGGRSGNRGRCAQPCRLLYLKDDRTGFDGSGSILDQPLARHFLSPKDLCGIDSLPELYSAGIASLKIEGRMKQAEYAAGVTSVYRHYIDMVKEDPASFKVEQADRDLLYDLYNRTGFTDGYLHRYNGPEMMAPVKHELTDDETARRHEAYAVMRGRYVEKESTVPVKMTARVVHGEELSLELAAPGGNARITSVTAEAALKRPMSESAIRERLARTGGSGFTVDEINVETDGESFVPLVALNELRREGLAVLSADILSRYRRKAEGRRDDILTRSGVSKTYETDMVLRDEPDEGSAAGHAFFDNKDGVQTRQMSMVSASVFTPEQLDAVLKTEYIATVYLESSMIASESDPFGFAMEMLSKVRESGKEAWIALPHIERDGHEWPLRTMSRELIEAGFKGFLVRCLESAAFYIENDMAANIRADYSLYTMNDEAERFLRDLGINGMTAPLELNRRELAARNNSDSEMIIYGYVPLMVTVQCLQKNTKGCTKDSPCHTLTDRMGVKFPVKSQCVFCYNIIRNSLPLYLADMAKEVGEMGFGGMRLMFTDEDRSQTREVLELVRKGLFGEEAAYPGKYTRGHFTRGVE